MKNRIRVVMRYINSDKHYICEILSLTNYLKLHPGPQCAPLRRYFMVLLLTIGIRAMLSAVAEVCHDPNRVTTVAQVKLSELWTKIWLQVQDGIIYHHIIYHLLSSIIISHHIIIMPSSYHHHIIIIYHHIIIIRMFWRSQVFFAHIDWKQSMGMRGSHLLGNHARTRKQKPAQDLRKMALFKCLIQEFPRHYCYRWWSSISVFQGFVSMCVKQIWLCLKLEVYILFDTHI